MNESLSLENLSNILDTVADPIFVKNEDHKWILLNEAFCKFMGYSREELLGRSDYDFFPKEQADVFWEKDNMVFKNGEANVNTESFDDADGITHIISTKKSIFTDINNKKILVGVIREITEYVSATDKAEKSAKAMTDFLTTMSHEIRTPMNGILGLLEVIDNNEGSKNNEELIGHVFQSAKNLQTILDDILDFNKIEKGLLSIYYDNLNIKDIFERVCFLFSSQVKEKNINLTYLINENVPEMIVSDESRLQQIIINLVSNAIKQTSKGEVALEAVIINGGLLQLSVTDSGPGVPNDKFNEIFTPFFQIDSSINRKVGGAGLGLAISSKLAGLLKGELYVKESSPEGSVFSLDIPLVTEGSDRKPIQNAPVLGDLSILSVDDNDINIIVMEAMLDAIGFSSFLSVTNGSDAIEKCQNQRFDLIFLDIEMPALDGFQTTKIIREHSLSLNKETIIIGVTAHVVGGIKKVCIDAGMNDYLRKPITKESLIEVIAKQPK